MNEIYGIYSIKMSTHQLKFETLEERFEWNKMREALAKHSCYSNKKKYYPHHMDVWEEERKAIEKSYRDKIALSNSLRLKKQKAKFSENLDKKLAAAEGLLLLSKKKVSGNEKKVSGKEKKVSGKDNHNDLKLKFHQRKSERIATMPVVHYYECDI